MKSWLWSCSLLCCSSSSTRAWSSSTSSTSHGWMRRLHTTSPLRLNRLLFDPVDVVAEGNRLTGLLPSSDDRFQHLKSILNCREGDQIRSGIMNKGISNAAVLLDDPQSPSLHTLRVDIGELHTAETSETSKSAEVVLHAPDVSIILAVQRPQRLEKIVTTMACVGIRQLHIINAAKSPNDYFGSQLMQNGTKMKHALREGLEQAEVDFRLPDVFIHKHIFPRPANHNLSHVLSTIQSNVGDRSLFPILLQAQFPVMVDEDNKLVLPGLSRMSEAFDKWIANRSNNNESSSSTKRPHVVLAIGPEGGWTEKELHYFVNQLHFTAVHMGPRILRTDIAIPAAISIANELLDSHFP